VTETPPIVEPPTEPGPTATNRLRGTAVVLGVVALVILVGAAFLPRWWAHRIADQADGSFTSGILLGLFYGFLFTILALVVLYVGLRRSHTWKGRVVTVALALLVAAPNLLTASISVGWGNAAHAGDRTLDVDAPGFRWSTAIGVFVAAALAVLVGYLVQSRREARAHASRLEAAGTPKPFEP
jgi:hypothetical protein